MNAKTIRPPFPWTLLRFWSGRLLFLWVVIAVMLILMQIATSGSVRDNKQVQLIVQMIDLFLPASLKEALGSDLIADGNLSALIVTSYTHPLTLILFMAFGVGAPTRMLTGSIERGTMDLILSRPVTKTQVYICAVAPTVGGMFGLAMLMLGGTFLGAWMFDLQDKIDGIGFFRVAINGSCLAIASGASGLLAASWCNRRATAVGVTIAFLMVNFFVSVFSILWSPMKFLEYWTLFAYIDYPRVFREKAWPWDDITVLASFSALAIIAGGIIWRRRDLP